MNQSPATVLRQLVAIVLMVVLTLGVVGRGVAAASDLHGVSAAGLPLCGQVGGANDGQPVHPADHDCCDQCTLCAPAVTPSAHVLAAPIPVAYVADHVPGHGWSPSLARVPTPRLSQGPPAA